MSRGSVRVTGVSRLRSLAVGALCLVAGCGEPAAPLGPSSLTAKLELSSLSVRVGASLTIRLNVTHTGDGSTVFSVFSDGHSFDPEIRNAGGSVVWTANANRTVSPVRKDVTITNSQPYSVEAVWPVTASDGRALPAGEYDLITHLDAVGLHPAFTEISARITVTTK